MNSIGPHASRPLQALPDSHPRRILTPVEPASLGAYRIVARLGAGGMGTVFHVRDPIGRDLAMKVVPPGASPRVTQRFQREARALARIDQHPGIVRVHAAGEDHGYHYYVMDLVPGPDLGATIARDGPLPADRAIRIAAAVARAVHHAHASGILHRDIKPSNVLLGPNGPVLTDFGLARDLQTEAALTRDGSILGTPGYMAPEQALGRQALVGPRSDIYGVGATLYAMLAGRPPFGDERASSSAARLAHEIATRPPPPIARTDLPNGLWNALARALAKTPDDRYASASDLADDLDRCLRGERIEAARGRGGGRRRLLPLGAALALGAVAGALLVAHAFFPPVPPGPSGRDPAPPSAPPPPAAAALAPLALLVAGDPAAARAEAWRRIASGRAESEDRIVLAIASIEAGRSADAIDLAARSPDDPDLAVLAALARAVIDGAPDRGLDDVRRFLRSSAGLEHLSAASLLLRANRPRLAAEEIERAGEAGGLAAALAGRWRGVVPAGGRGDSLPPPEPPPAWAGLTDDQRAAIAEARDLWDAGNFDGGTRRLVAAFGGRIPPDADPSVFRTMASVRRDFAWVWATAQRDVLYLLNVFVNADFWLELPATGATSILQYQAFSQDPGLAEEDVRSGVAVMRYYTERKAPSFAGLGPAWDELDRLVVARPWSAAPRLYRGLVAVVLGCVASGLADVDTAIAMAGSDLARAVLGLVAAEGVLPIAPERARAWVEAYAAAMPEIRRLRLHDQGVPDPYEVGNLRRLAPR